MWEGARSECARAPYRYVCQAPTSERLESERFESERLESERLEGLIETVDEFSKLPTIEGVASTSPHR